MISQKLIDKLKEQRFWKNVVADPDLQIEIRPRNRITVYYSGAALLRELRLKGDRLVCKTHFKYVPTVSKKDYVLQVLTEEVGLQIEDPPEPISICRASKKALRQYKQCIDLKAGPESKIVQRICSSDKNLVIDQEIVFDATESRDRVDLALIRPGTSTVVMVEVKRFDDSRLFLYRKGRPEVIDQLRRYKKWIRKNRSSLLERFNKTIEAKRRLGVGDQFDDLSEPLQDIDPLPILVIGDCDRKTIKMIQQGEGAWSALTDPEHKLDQCCGGVLTFGKDGKYLKI